MKIAGLQKLSLVDFPGYLSAVIFVQGCNFWCPYCQNPDLVTSDKDFKFSEEKVFDFLAHKRGKIEGVVITGGEPALYDDLPDVIKRIKEMGFRVKLDTNGSNPDQIENLRYNHLVDYIALDIKTSLSKYDLVTNIKNISDLVIRSIQWVMLSTVAYEFRTTCVPGIVDEEDILSIGRDVRGAMKYCLQQFRPNITLDKEFRKVKPYDLETLRKFQNILSHFVEAVEIRGV